MNEKKLDAFKVKLNEIHHVFLGIKTIHACLFSQNDYDIKSKIFSYFRKESIMLLIGRLITILSDKKKQYETVSLKILIEEALEIFEASLHNDLKKMLRKIDQIDDKFRTFRDKCVAHIELKKNHKMYGFNDFIIKPKEITELVEMAETIYDKLFLFAKDAGSDHMNHDIEKLSSILWDSYKKAGLVK